MSRSWHVTLWTTQILLALTFAGTGIWKLLTPRAELGQIFPWMAEVSSGLFYTTAVFDLLGGLGVLLPTLTRILPWLTPWAALGCAALQGSAIVFHLTRGEAANTPFNYSLVAVSLFVAWGRRRQP